MFWEPKKVLSRAVATLLPLAPEPRKRTAFWQRESGTRKKPGQLVEDILSVVWEDPLYKLVYGWALGFGVPRGIDLNG